MKALFPQTIWFTPSICKWIKFCIFFYLSFPLRRRRCIPCSLCPTIHLGPCQLSGCPHCVITIISQKDGKYIWIWRSRRPARYYIVLWGFLETLLKPKGPTKKFFCKVVLKPGSPGDLTPKVEVGGPD